MDEVNSLQLVFCGSRRLEHEQCHGAFHAESDGDKVNSVQLIFLWVT